MNRKVAAKKPLAERLIRLRKPPCRIRRLSRAAQEKGFSVIQQTEPFTLEQPDKALSQTPALVPSGIQSHQRESD